jgi:epoxyqueuosine reductase QueG
MRRALMFDHNTETVKSILNNIFDSVGIANKERFINAPEEYHPKNILDGFESVIVYAQGNKNGDANTMGSFSNIWGSIAAQNEVVKFLESLGYKSIIIQGDSKSVSLVHMGIEAGLGEMSPVNSLVIKGLGLTASLAAIITEAPLIPDEKVASICIKCMKCMKVCPATKVAYHRNPKECGCGKCRNICPI